MPAAAKPRVIDLAPALSMIDNVAENAARDLCDADPNISPVAVWCAVFSTVGEACLEKVRLIEAEAAKQQQRAR